jgi:hypothetical protein
MQIAPPPAELLGDLGRERRELFLRCLVAHDRGDDRDVGPHLERSDERFRSPHYLLQCRHSSGPARAGEPS